MNCVAVHLFPLSKLRGWIAMMGKDQSEEKQGGKE